MVAIVAMFTVKDGAQSEFESVFDELARQVRANEPDCLVYDLCRKKDSSTEYVILERYRDADAVARHMKTDYFRALGTKIAGCLEGRPTIAQYDALSHS